MGEWQRWRETHPLAPLLPLAYTLIFRVLLPSGIRWIWKLLRLIAFAILLIPAWISIFWFYLRSENIKRNVRYGPNPRNYLDIYYPDHIMGGERAPVLIFITGGAWIIGYKAWGCLLSKILMEMGIVCVNPDYRNFPQGHILDMLEDTEQAVQWVLDNIQSYGGDPTRVFLAGQSAGAHLGLMSILRSTQKGQNRKWSCDRIKGFIGISGPYNIEKMKINMHRRGLHRKVFEEIFKMETDEIVSPDKFIELYCDSNTILPPLYFFHGTNDESCPHCSTEEIVKILQEKKVKTNIRAKYYPGKSHTDLILEDLMHDDTVHEGDLMHDICKIVHQNRMDGYLEFVDDNPSASPKRCRPKFLSQSKDIYNPSPSHSSQTIMPRFPLTFSRRVNPF